MYLIFPYNWQDCVCLVAPYPYGPSTKDQFNVKTDMDLIGDGLLWYARPQLFFNCTVAPVGQLARKARHTELSLVFFSTFEPIKLTPNSVMQRNGVPMFFDSASSTNLPSLYICRAENVLGRVPLMPCYIGGNSHPTLPHRFGNQAGATADSSVDRGNGTSEAGSMSSTSGCGAMGGRSPESSQLRMLRRCGGCVFKSHGAGEPKP